MGVNSNDQIYFRTGIDVAHPSGTGWRLIDGRLKQLSVRDGRIMGVNSQDHIYFRHGINVLSPSGTKWQQIGGALKYIACGDGKVMGVNTHNQIWYETQSLHTLAQKGSNLEFIHIETLFVFCLSVCFLLHFFPGTTESFLQKLGISILR